MAVVDKTPKAHPIYLKNAVDNSSSTSHIYAPIITHGARKLANSPQARKRARQSEKRRQQNAGNRSLYRTRIKQVLSFIESGDKENAEKAYSTAVSVVDRMANKKIIHRNKAARHKSRLLKHIRSMA